MEAIADKKISYDELLSQNARLKSENAYLKQELAQIKRLIFGQRRERFISAGSHQMAIALDGGPQPAPTPATEEITYSRRKKVEKNKPSRSALPAHLPRDVVVIESDEDTTGMQKIGEAVTEELEYTPATLRVTCYVRPKYARPNSEGVVIGVLPNRPIDKGKSGPGLLAHVTIEREAQEADLSHADRRKLRQAHALPILKELETWLRHNHLSTLPESRIGKAIRIRAEALG